MHTSGEGAHASERGGYSVQLHLRLKVEAKGYGGYKEGLRRIFGGGGGCLEINICWHRREHDNEHMIVSAEHEEASTY